MVCFMVFWISIIEPSCSLLVVLFYKCCCLVYLLVPHLLVLRRMINNLYCRYVSIINWESVCFPATNVVAYWMQIRFFGVGLSLFYCCSPCACSVVVCWCFSVFFLSGLILCVCILDVCCCWKGVSHPVVSACFVILNICIGGRDSRRLTFFYAGRDPTKEEKTKQANSS